MKILFIIFSSIAGFIAGLFIGGISLSGNEGLAGSAVVLSYGILGFLIVLLLSLFLIKKIKINLLKKMTIILIAISVIGIGWLIVRIQTNIPEEPQKKNLKPITEPVTAPASLYLPEKNEAAEMGLGMAKPDFFNKRTLYFYSPNFDKAVADHLPTDSLVFSQTDHHQYDLSYAPPWFYPEHLKMDYEILYMKILTMGRDWVEVEINKQSGLSAWVSSSDIDILLWPEFLLTVFSVEDYDEENNYLRIKPMLHAARWQGKEFSFLSPVMIKENWLKVKLFDDNLIEVGEAWLQWCTDGKLLISYSLLS